MTGTQHISLGFTMGITAACLTFNEPSTVAGFTAICTVASIFPDIDVKNSKIAQKLKISSFITRLFLKHRSITHTPLFLGLTCWLIHIISAKSIPLPDYTMKAWIMGYMIHLIQDTFTSGGIKWLFPLWLKPISLLKIKSKSFLGYIASFVLYGIGVALILTNIIRL